jgi:hypothetical protein
MRYAGGMTSSRSSITTRVSRFPYLVAISAIVACMHAAATRTELDGSFPCGTLTCGSGQICVDNGICGSNNPEPPDTYACETPSESCSLASCNYNDITGSASGNCPQCVLDLCKGSAGYNNASFDGERSLDCELDTF